MTAKKIKLIYCYLVCLSLTMTLTFSSAFLISNTVDLVYFNDFGIPGYLQPTDFAKNPENASLKPEELKIARQKAIKKYKSRSYIKGNLSLISIIFFASLALFIHVYLIRRTKDD